MGQYRTLDVEVTIEYHYGGYNSRDNKIRTFLFIWNKFFSLTLAPIDCHSISGCEKKVCAEKSQALLGTKESAAKERTKAKKLLILSRQLLPYHTNGWAICLPFCIGTTF